MFFVAPLFFIALCLWIERGLPRPRAAAACAVVAAALVGVVPYSGLLNGNATSDTLAFLPLWTLQDTITTLDEIGMVVVLVAIALALLLLLVPVRYALALPAALFALYAVSLWAIETNPHGGVHHASLGALFGGTSSPDREWIDHAVGAGSNVGVIYDSATMDKFTVWTNEFFNRSVHKVAYLADPTPGGLPETKATIGRDGYIHGLDRPRYVLSTLPLIGKPVARDKVKGLTVWRIDGTPRLQFRTSGVYPDGWMSHQATITKFKCDGQLSVALRQGKLFSRPQIVIVNGRSYRVNGRRTITINGCRARIHVADTRVPGPEDPRELGIIVDGFR